MSKLFSANLMRLRRSRVFWFCLLAMLAFSAMSMYSAGHRALMMIREGYVLSLDEYFFMQVPFIGLAEGIFVSLFLGTEHGDGTIRNKIIVGHSRAAIYFAAEGVCLLACLAFAAACVAGSLVGVPVLGWTNMDAGAFALYLLILAFFTAALCSIFVLAGMLCTSRAFSPVLAILLFMALLSCAGVLYSKLCEPETIRGVMMTENGLEMGEPSSNPNYVSGTLRMVYFLILNVLPTGQAILMSHLEIKQPMLLLVSSALIFAAASGAGAFAFGRKDLR